MSQLFVYVTGALNLKNKDTGVLGDVSDPYVVVKVAGTEQKTYTIDNDLNPQWRQQQPFQFRVGLEDSLLEFKVMNSNYLKDDPLGTAEVDLLSIQHDRWCKFRQRLTDGDKGEIEFNVYFQLTDYHKAHLEHTSLLYVRVNGATNLKNLDTGVLGDVSDPYVSVRMGEGKEFKTPTLDNNLNPTWKDGNNFTLHVGDHDTCLNLEVLNSNFRKDDSLGTFTLHIDHLEHEYWKRFTEKLENGNGAEIEFDVYFQASEMMQSKIEHRQAKSAAVELGAKAATLAKKLQVAEYASKWMEDVGSNSAMPLSVEERDWEQACSGRNLVIPAWIHVKTSQVDARNKRQSPPVVALFPEATSVDKKPPKLRIKLLGAEGLRSATLGDRPNAYCACEIPLKPKSRVETKPIPGTNFPEWRHAQNVKDYALGDSLVLDVFCAHGERSAAAENRTKRRASGRTSGSLEDELLGRAWLKGDQVYPNGFDGVVDLYQGSRRTDAILRVTAIVIESDE